MTAEAVDLVLLRAMDDAAFRATLAADPQGALAGYDLSPDERARFVVGTAKAERLEERISKSDLSAGVSVKASSPRTRPPSHGKKVR